ncbi:MAG: matrixin family metalloprotease [Cyanobacteria bacterium NC_groundwater_1444_Ag_S-0.65um_54_12]|nr:matrixin family metalloprotease [Cyanobacteria bacterium NC_groundwater_1444_Ag_S-0.65um_54_12]
MRLVFLFLLLAFAATACMGPTLPSKPPRSPIGNLPAPASNERPVAIVSGVAPASNKVGDRPPSTNPAPPTGGKAGQTPGQNEKAGDPLPGSNGSELLATSKLDLRRLASKNYIPLIKFDNKGSYYLRWSRATVIATVGERPFTATELSYLRGEIDRLNSAIGHRVFAFTETGTGDIPIAIQSTTNDNALGFAQFLLQTFATGRSYVESKVILHLANLGRYAPEPDRYGALFGTVTLHELGHVAGLDHNPQEGTLMNASTETTPRVVGFSQNEIDTLRLLYDN